MTLKPCTMCLESNSSEVKDNSGHTENTKEKKEKRSFKKFLREYCDTTTIHGLKYIAEEHRPLFERICWLIAFVLSVAAAAYLIYESWNEWDQRPVIVSFADRTTPLFQIPFPAITICSVTKATQEHLKYAELIHKSKNQDNMTSDELDKFRMMSLLCELVLTEEGERFANDSIIKFYKEVGPNFTDVVSEVIWKSQKHNPKDLLSPVLTDEGICYTFNMLNASDVFTEHYKNDQNLLAHGPASEDWSLDNGYAKGAGVYAYPHRALGAGTTAGITFILGSNKEDFDHVCMGPIQGFKILLHNSVEIPQVREHYMRVPLEEELIVRVIPSMMTTSDKIKHYTPHRRECYYPSERPLKFFKVYTESNCDLECLTNFTMHMCGCVAFYMPRDNSMPICGSGSLDCLHRAKNLLLVQEVLEGVDDPKKKPANCDCLQACTELLYEIETSSAKYDWNKTHDAVKAHNKNSRLIFAKLTVAFKDSQFITSQRNELYVWTDFLASCGGLLGLCLGFSVLSLVEIICHLIRRIPFLSRPIQKE